MAVQPQGTAATTNFCRASTEQGSLNEYIFRSLKANAFPPKWKLLKTHSSLFHAVMELCPTELLRHVELFALALNDPSTNVLFYLGAPLCFFVAGFCLSACHLTASPVLLSCFNSTETEGYQRKTTKSVSARTVTLHFTWLQATELDYDSSFHCIYLFTLYLLLLLLL